MNYRLSIVSIHVQYWRQGYFSNIGAIRTRASVQIICGKTDLVVHHNMDRTSRSISVKLRHLHYLIHHSLPCNGSIAVNQNRHHFSRIALIISVLFCSSNPFHYGVYRFQMRRVWRNVHINLISCIGKAF